MTEYSDQIKAQALAALLAGQSFSEVARQMGVPIGTLKSWKQRNADALDAAVAVDATSATAKKERDRRARLTTRSPHWKPSRHNKRCSRMKLGSGNNPPAKLRYFTGRFR